MSATDFGSDFGVHRISGQKKFAGCFGVRAVRTREDNYASAQGTLDVDIYTPGSASLSATATVSAGGTVTRAGSAALSATATVSAVGDGPLPPVEGLASLDATALSDAVGGVLRAGSASLDATATISAVGAPTSPKGGSSHGALVAAYAAALARYKREVPPSPEEVKKILRLQKAMAMIIMLEDE